MHVTIATWDCGWLISGGGGGGESIYYFDICGVGRGPLGPPAGSSAYMYIKDIATIATIKA